LNKLMASSKPPVLAEADLIDRGKRSTIAIVEALMAIVGAKSTMIGNAVSTMVGEAESMKVGDAVSTMVGEAESTMIGDAVLTMVGEGAGESVDPDPAIPTVGAN
jgi:hypothetical protein